LRSPPATLPHRALPAAGAHVSFPGSEPAWEGAAVEGGPCGMAREQVAAEAEPGEFVLRKEAVQTIGVANLNAINAGGHVSTGGGSSPNAVYVSAPIVVQAGQRVLAETNVHFAAKRVALSEYAGPA